MKAITAILAIIFLAACSTAPKESAEDAVRDPAGHASCGVDVRTLTVYRLKEMAEANKVDELNCLFDHGDSQASLPLGYAAGTGANVLGFNFPGLRIAAELTKVADNLTDKNWRGKIFFRGSATESHGLNRIKEVVMGSNNIAIVPMAAFETQMLTKNQVPVAVRPLVPNVHSNFVVLNYAHPVTSGYFQEKVLTQIQVYDVMVAVNRTPGRHPIYIGKTWQGRYGADGVFQAFDAGKLIAWYFLDFTQEGVTDQVRNHWDGTPDNPGGSDETPINYGK